MTGDYRQCQPWAGPETIPHSGGYRDHGLPSHTHYRTGRKQPTLSSGPRIHRRAHAPPRPEPWEPPFRRRDLGMAGNTRSLRDTTRAETIPNWQRTRDRPCRSHPQEVPPMADIHRGRFTADVSVLGDEIVVYLIGARINKPWKFRTWWPVFAAMPKILTYLPTRRTGCWDTSRPFCRRRSSCSTGVRSKTRPASRHDLAAVRIGRTATEPSHHPDTALPDTVRGVVDPAR
ncbi:monooxygenase family protein [Rhodococcus koreensis]|uniref:monooxygenase family protein n=2 Tax=Nocardiaceae TaxID=85025 RepID=UPI003B848823